GVFALLVRLLGVGTTAQMSIDDDGFSNEQTSFRGVHRAYVPRGQMGATLFVIARPVELLTLGLPLLLVNAYVLYYFIAPARRPDADLLIFASLVGVGMGIVLVAAFLFLPSRVLLGVVTTAGACECMKLRVTGSDIERLEKAAGIFGAITNLVAQPAATYVGVPLSSKAIPHYMVACPECKTEMLLPNEAKNRRVRCHTCHEIFRAPLE